MQGTHNPPIEPSTSMVQTIIEQALASLPPQDAEFLRKRLKLSEMDKLPDMPTLRRMSERGELGELRELEKLALFASDSYKEAYGKSNALPYLLVAAIITPPIAAFGDFFSFTFRAILLLLSLLFLVSTFVCIGMASPKHIMKAAAKRVAKRLRTMLDSERKAQEREDAEVAKRGFTTEAALSYYDACLSRNIPDLETEIRRQKALLLAQSKDEWNFPDIGEHYAEMFLSGKAQADELEAQERRAELQERIKEYRPAESAAVALNESLSELSGREKRRHILQTQLDDARRRLKGAEAEKTRQAQAEGDAFRAQAALYQAMSEKEKDWALHAGLADGIAGPGAGFAVATQIQAENAAIRQRNENLRKAIFASSLPTANSDFYGTDDLRRTVSALERQMEDLNIKLTDETVPAQTLMDALETSAFAQESDSGAAAVSVGVRATKDFLIAGEAQAAIDGGFSAELLRDGEVVGNAYIPLPTMGICAKDGWLKLTGYCLALDGSQTYDVRLSPKRLWLIER